MNQEERQGVGDIYQESTKYRRHAMPVRLLEISSRPSMYKTYSNPVKVVTLPEAERQGGMGLWDALLSRRSERRYAEKPMDLKTLSQLLWAIQGVTASMGSYLLRTAPSAGALYPIETYLVVNRVEELDQGVYHFQVPNACLELLSPGDYSGRTAAAALDQPIAAKASVVFIWTACVNRSKWKYDERAYRYIYLDAGHLCENLYLACAAMGLGCCAIGAFYDEEVNEILKVDGKEEMAVYLSSVGPVG